jgi:hypothetical protein
MLTTTFHPALKGHGDFHVRQGFHLVSDAALHFREVLVGNALFPCIALHFNAFPVEFALGYVVSFFYSFGPVILSLVVLLVLDMVWVCIALRDVRKFRFRAFDSSLALSLEPLNSLLFRRIPFLLFTFVSRSTLTLPRSPSPSHTLIFSSPLLTLSHPLLFSPSPSLTRRGNAKETSLYEDLRKHKNVKTTADVHETLSALREEVKEFNSDCLDVKVLGSIPCCCIVLLYFADVVVLMWCWLSALREEVKELTSDCLGVKVLGSIPCLCTPPPTVHSSILLSALLRSRIRSPFTFFALYFPLLILHFLFRYRLSLSLLATFLYFPLHARRFLFLSHHSLLSIPSRLLNITLNPKFISTSL